MLFLLQISAACHLKLGRAGLHLQSITMTVILQRAKNSSMEDAMVIPTILIQLRLAATLADSFVNKCCQLSFQIQVLYFNISLSVCVSLRSKLKML